MSVPQQAIAGLVDLQAELVLANPLESATQMQLNTLQKQASDLVDSLGTYVASAGVPLDAGDPSGYSGSFPDFLKSLSEASADQAKLVEAVGLVGRALFNVTQVAS